VGVNHPFIAPPPTCKAYPIVILLHAHCAIYAPPPTSLVYALHSTLLVMAISRKGQVKAASEVALLLRETSISIEMEIEIDIDRWPTPIRSSRRETDRERDRRWRRRRRIQIDRES